MAERAAVPAETQDSIYAWAEETFPEHTIETIVLHIVSEVGELAIAANVPWVVVVRVLIDAWSPENSKKKRTIVEELADLDILNQTAAGKLGYQLALLTGRKMHINRARVWSKTPNALGFRKHIEQKGGA